MSSPGKRREMDVKKLMMSDYKVEMVNDGMSEFYVEFHGPRDSGLQKRITEFRENGDPVKWVANDSVKELGLTTSVRKIYEMYLKHLKPHRRKEVDG